MHVRVCKAPFTRYNRLLNRLYNRFDNRLNVCTQTFNLLSNRFNNRFDNRLYRVNGALAIAELLLKENVLLLLSLVCQEAPVASRSLSRSVGSVALLAAYCNIFLNPLIYILLYDVVKRSLTSLVQPLTARVINQQQPVAN